jgi:K+-sensing histidine kinase KdpD
MAHPMLDSLTEAEVALLLQMHKEATLGRLVSGLVHELRNPINSIANSAQLLEERGEQEALRDKLLPVITRSSDRVQKLLEAVELHRADQHSPPVDLHHALETCMEVLVYLVRHVEYHPSGVKEEALVEGEPHQIWFVLLSLLETMLAGGAKNLWLRSHEEDANHVLVLEHDGPAICSGSEEDDNQKASLAIALSRILVQQAAGELHCARREPIGSCLTLTLRKVRSRSNDQDPLR